MYELHHRDAESGGFLYFTFRRPDGEQNYWNHASETWQALTVANWLEYAMLMTELPPTGQIFKGTLPPLSAQMVPDWYWAEIYAGGETEGPLISDSRIAGYLGYWNGSRFRYWSPDDEQTLTQLATLLAPLLWANPTRTVTDVLGKVLGGGSSSITGVGVRAEEVAAITSVAADAVTGATQIFLHSVSGIEAGSLIRVGWSPWTLQQLLIVTEVNNVEAPLNPSIRCVPPLALDALVGDTVEIFRGKHLNRFNFSDTPGTSTLLARLSTEWAGAAVDHEALAEQVWQNPTRTLTTPAHLMPAGPLNGTALTLIRGNTFSLTLTGLGAITGRLVFTVKKSPFAQTVDKGAELQIDSEAGLLRLNGNPVNTPGWGSITVQDAVAGNVLITIAASAMAQLSIFHGGKWDVKEITADNPPIATTRVTGPAEVLPDTTRAIE